MTEILLTLLLIPAAIIAWSIAIGMVLLLVACIEEFFRG